MACPPKSRLLWHSRRLALESLVEINNNCYSIFALALGQLISIKDTLLRKYIIDIKNKKHV